MDSLLHLASDMWICIFTFLRLRNIISLTVVSKQMRIVSLLNENWYTISDTNKILYGFVCKIFESRSDVPYPFHKIKQMNSTNYCNKLRFGGYLKLFKIFPKNQKDYLKFYDHFPDYQYLCTPRIDHDKIFYEKTFKGIYNYHWRYDIIEPKSPHNITEIIMPNIIMFDCEILMKCFPQIEKLVLGNIKHVGYPEY
jgi:hypothetical protein